MACFIREGTSAKAVYGKHILQNNFALAIMLEMGCCLNYKHIYRKKKSGKNLSHQPQVIFKIWDILTC